VKRLEDELNLQLKDKDIKVSIRASAVNYFVDEGYDSTMGARPLKRLFESELKKPLSKKILFEDLKNTKIKVEYIDDNICITDLK